MRTDALGAVPLKGEAKTCSVKPLTGMGLPIASCICGVMIFCAADWFFEASGR